MFNILLVGVGGQGTILASKILQKLFLNKGYYIKSTETIGMAQMGGSVTSHIRIGDDIYSPFVPEKSANIIFAFEPGEGARNIRFANKDTKVIVNTQAIKPVTDTLAKKDYEIESSLKILQDYTQCYECNFSNFFEKLGTNKVLNITLLAYSIGLGIIDIGKEEMAALLEKEMPEKIYDINLKALEYGFEKGRSYE